MTALRRLTIGLDVSELRHGLTNGTAVYEFKLAQALLRLDEALNVRLHFTARAEQGAEAALSALEGAGVRIFRGPAPWRWSPDGAWWLAGGPPLGRFLHDLNVLHAGIFHLPRHPRVPCVVTVHDLATLTLPRDQFWLNTVVHARRIRWIRRRRAHVIASSAHTRDQLVELAGIDPERIHVVRLARGREPRSTDGKVALDTVRRRYGLGDRRYVLSVGTLEARKNHVRLIRAFAGLPGDLGDVLLVLVGAMSQTGREAEALARAPALRDRVRLFGTVDDDELGALYAGAAAFALPSLHEGFGLPVLEAMAAGTPVLAADAAALPEVTGDAALLVDPFSVDDIRRGLERLLREEGLRAVLVERGRRRERQFTWERTARETLDVYREAIR